MKTFLIILTFLIASCHKDNNSPIQINVIGNWVNEQKDTLSFVDSHNVSYLNYNPYCNIPYNYHIKGDSLVLIFFASNSINGSKTSYLFLYHNEYFELYHFNNVDTATYYRLKK